MPQQLTAWGWPWWPTDADTSPDFGAATQPMAQTAEDREVHEWTQAELDALSKVGLRPGRLFVLRPAAGAIRLLRWDGQAMRDVTPPDPIATDAGLRTLGPGAQQAAPGDHAHVVPTALTQMARNASQTLTVSSRLIASGTVALPTGWASARLDVSGGFTASSRQTSRRRIAAALAFGVETEWAGSVSVDNGYSASVRTSSHAPVEGHRTITASAPWEFRAEVDVGNEAGDDVIGVLTLLKATLHRLT